MCSLNHFFLLRVSGGDGTVIGCEAGYALDRLQAYFKAATSDSIYFISKQKH